MRDNSKLGIRFVAIFLAVIVALVCLVHLFLSTLSSQDEYDALINDIGDEVLVNTKEQPIGAVSPSQKLDLLDEAEQGHHGAKKFIEQDPAYTAHTPHPWELVEVTPIQAQLCNDMVLTPLTYKEVFDNETNQIKRVYSDYYDLNLVILHNGKEYSISSVYNEGTEKWINTQMHQYLDRVYETFSDWLGPEKLYKTEINIKLALNQTQYFNALAQFDSEESANVQGVYLPWLHTGFVKIPHNDKNQIIGMRLLQVLVHEAVHAINYVQFGYMHRWAQEGIAQYFTHFVDNASPELFLNYEEWEHRSNALAEPLSLQDLIEPSGYWMDNRSALYATSFAYVQYFSSLAHQDNHLISLLNTELKQRCSVLNKNWSQTQLDPDNSLYANMQNWFEHTVIYYSERAEESKNVRLRSEITH